MVPLSVVMHSCYLTRLLFCSVALPFFFILSHSLARSLSLSLSLSFPHLSFFHLSAFCSLLFFCPFFCSRLFSSRLFSYFLSSCFSFSLFRLFLFLFLSLNFSISLYFVLALSPLRVLLVHHKGDPPSDAGPMPQQACEHTPRTSLESTPSLAGSGSSHPTRVRSHNAQQIELRSEFRKQWTEPRNLHPLASTIDRPRRRVSTTSFNRANGCLYTVSLSPDTCGYVVYEYLTILALLCDMTIIPYAIAWELHGSGGERALCVTPT